MDFVLVIAAAAVASGLTMFSGFGLGTLLLPVFALFLPVELAVAATALVHGANNVLKVALLGRDADARVVLRFGLPAFAGVILGRRLLKKITMKTVQRITGGLLLVIALLLGLGVL